MQTFAVRRRADRTVVLAQRVVRIDFVAQLVCGVSIDLKAAKSILGREDQRIVLVGLRLVGLVCGSVQGSIQINDRSAGRIENLCGGVNERSIMMNGV